MIRFSCVVVVRHDAVRAVQNTAKKTAPPARRRYWRSAVSTCETEPLKNHASRFLWIGLAGVFAAHEAPATRGCWRSASENPQAFAGIDPKRNGREPSLAASEPQGLIVELSLVTAMFITKVREVESAAGAVALR